MGCISVTANIAPKLCSELQNSWIDKNIEQRLKEINLKLANFIILFFLESSPGPVKYAAEFT